MTVVRLFLFCVLLENGNINLGSAISSDVGRQDFPAATTPSTHDDNVDHPSFARAIGNVTAPSGREAILSCTINNLGNYKVGWLRAEDQTVLSIGQRTVTHSTRFFVSLERVESKNRTRGRETIWSLHIRSLGEADRGCYMCQVNTNPMLSQLGCVDVLVGPDILTSGTSEGEVSVLEGENTTLACNASGRPPPQVLWRREKNKFILMRRQLHHDQLDRVDTFFGKRLDLTRVDRRQMGAYLCIAKNEVPPAVSKRVYLSVNFPPSAKVTNQMLGSPLNTDVSLVCLIEAFPKTINFWSKNSESVIMNGARHVIEEVRDAKDEWKTTVRLKIKSLERSDLGEYTCSAESSMGKANATLRLHEIDLPTLPTSSINWRKSYKVESKAVEITTLQRVRYQLSTPSMRKSTSWQYHNKFLTTTTMDPRAPLTRDNAFERNDVANERSRAISIADANWMYAPWAILGLFLR